MVVYWEPFFIGYIKGFVHLCASSNFVYEIDIQGHDAGSNGWTHEFVIHMFQQQKPGTIPVAVGHADCASGEAEFMVYY